ncbi:MAG: hypothetical protein ABEK01_02155 [Candidatus Nanohaloarchaea archaeon]
MQERLAALSLLFLAVVGSGCIHDGGDNVVGDTGAITIQEFSAGSNSVMEGAHTIVDLEIRNTGEIPAEISIARQDVPQDQIAGRKLLSNYCPGVFTLSPENFEVSTSVTDMKRHTYTLKPEDRAKFQWRLTATGDIPQQPIECDVTANIVFNYSVTAYKQLQIKNTTETNTLTGLESRSSRGPLNIYVEMVGSSAEENRDSVLIHGDSVDILLQIEDTENKKGAYNSLYRIYGDFEEQITATRGEVTNCSAGGDNEITMVEGESETIRCDYMYPGQAEGEPLPAKSIRTQISANLDYQYRKEVGPITIEVKNRGS